MTAYQVNYETPKNKTSLKEKFRNVVGVSLTVFGLCTSTFFSISSMRADYNEGERAFRDKIAQDIQPSLDEARLYQKEQESEQGAVAGAIIVGLGALVSTKTGRRKTVDFFFK